MTEKKSAPGFNKILIVDDAAANLQFLTNLLTERGYKVYPASDGELALEFVRLVLPDLILLDIRMPVMDGYEVCRQLKSDKRTSSIPVIFISILENESDKIKAFQEGGVDYITKPFHPEEILARVKNQLRLRQLTDHLENTVSERTEELCNVNEQLQNELTERMHAEEELKSERMLLTSIMETSPIGITTVDRCGKVIFANSQAVTILGLTISEITNRTYNDPGWHITDFSGNTFPEEQLPFRQVMKTLKPVFDVQHAIVWPDGRRVFLSVNGAPTFDEMGQIERVVFTLQDITERKQADFALVESEEKYRRLAENARDTIYRMSLTDGNYEYVSPAAYSMFGYLPEEFYSNPLLFQQMIHPEWRTYFEEQKINLLKGEMPPTYEYQIIHKSGEVRWLNQRNILVADREGKPLAIEGIVTDITERKLAEEEIRRFSRELEDRVKERTAELETTNRELEAFSYSVSHDLRAPLRHIDGFLELLLMGSESVLDERSKHYMATISESSRRMGILIDDLLSFSRMGRVEMSKMQLDIATLIKDIIRELEPDMAGRNIHWHIAQLPVITGDRALLRTVLVNLISNALKFTRPREQTEIEIGCINSQTEDIIFIRDNGVGYDPKYKDKLFNVFQRLHHTDEFEGTGIGLANVRRIINRHGGRTWAEGKVDDGAAFYFSIPKCNYV
jgi:PAS domain S-box-containing protein